MKANTTLLLFAALSASIHAQQAPTPQPQQATQTQTSPSPAATAPSSTQTQTVPCTTTPPKPKPRPSGVTWHVPTFIENAFRRKAIALDETTGVRVNGAQVESNALH